MKTETLTVLLTFTEPILGSASGNKDIHAEYIASKAPTLADAAEEVAAIDPKVAMEKAMTIFPRDDKGLFLFDYQVRGFFKEAILVGIELGQVKGLSKYNHKKAVDSLLFVTPRKIYLRNAAGEIYTKAPSLNSRPLRAETMHGERVALATSEELPADTNVEFTVNLLTGDNSKSKLAVIDRDHLTWALNYGQLKGFGQWRSGGYGRFTWSEKAK